MDEILKAKLSEKLKKLFKKDKKTQSIIERLDEYVLRDMTSFRNELPELMADIIDD